MLHARSAAIAPILILVTGLSGCSQSPADSDDPVRLVDQMAEAIIEGTAESAPLPQHGANWSFEKGRAGWLAPMGIDGFDVRDNALVGRTSMPGSELGPGPVLVVSLPELPEDELWAIEITARVSTGANMTARFGRGDELNLPAVLGNPMGIFHTPLQAGDDTNTYSIRPSNPVKVGEGPGHLVISPSDAVGADFAIERIRLLLRKEYLQSVPSGPGWHGLQEVYNETIVSRAPETLHFDVELPQEPFLELTVGTLEPSRTTFRVEISADGVETRQWETTINEPDVWHVAATHGDSAPEDGLLAGLGGKQVRLSLSIDGAENGTLGLWGSPVIRAGAPPEITNSPGQPQGVILILTDTLRKDHLEAYGYSRATAPAIATMANEGVRFADAISQATWTKVSVPAIQTGLYPTTHTIKDFPDRLPASATTLAEAFRSAGYATLGLTSIPFVGRMTNLHQGYETLHEPGAMSTTTDLENGATEKSSLLLVPKMLEWLETRGNSKFFGFLHVADAHSPFRPTPEHELHFAAAGEMDQLDQLTEQVRPKIKHPLMQRFGMPERSELVEAKVDPAEFVRLEENGMDGSIKGMDTQIGALFSKLDELGLRDKVLVALVSDHGTELLEHGRHFHGHTLYGELNRVPMQIWGPAFVPQGVEINATVQTIDLMPTLLELAGLPLPKNIQGASLEPLWSNPEGVAWRRPAITEMPQNFRGTKGWSIISEDWKLVRVGGWEDEPLYELYSHSEDPLNSTDLAAANSQVVDRMVKLLENWRANALTAKLDDTAANATLDSAELERLRSMGYVQ